MSLKQAGASSLLMRERSTIGMSDVGGTDLNRQDVEVIHDVVGRIATAVGLTTPDWLRDAGSCGSRDPTLDIAVRTARILTLPLRLTVQVVGGGTG